MNAVPHRRLRTLTKIDPCYQGMCIKSIWIYHVAETDHIQLLLFSGSSGIDGKQDRPSDQTAHKANNHRYLQISEQEVTIERLMVEDIAIGYLTESPYPIEQSSRQIRCSISELPQNPHQQTLPMQSPWYWSHSLRSQRGQVRTRRVCSLEPRPQNEPQGDIYKGENGDRSEGGDQLGQGR